MQIISIISLTIASVGALMAVFYGFNNWRATGDTNYLSWSAYGVAGLLVISWEVLAHSIWDNDTAITFWVRQTVMAIIIIAGIAKYLKDPE